MLSSGNDGYNAVRKLLNEKEEFIAMNNLLFLFLTNVCTKASLRALIRLFALNGITNPKKAISNSELNAFLNMDKRNLSRDLSELVRNEILSVVRNKGERCRRYYIPKQILFKMKPSIEDDVLMFKERKTISDTKQTFKGLR